ncbi:MAG TPA: Fic family protein [Enhygromyxa sp.]|nr:Fic family protein [Enhygromyxa sp.]
MIYGLYPLTWDELARGRGPVELRAVEPALRKLAVELTRATGSDKAAWLIQDEISRVLIEQLGMWASGWCWSTSDGGLNRAWTSVRRDETAESMVARILAAVREWHATIEALACEFEALRPDDAAPLAEVVEHAGAKLVAWVIERTGAHDAWYGSFVAVLAWYLQAWALDDASAEAELERVVSGHFESWVKPNAAQIRSTCTELGATIVRRYDAVQPDATHMWIGARRQAFSGLAHEPTWASLRPPGDGHRRFIEGLERRRDRVRADRMRAALGSCRKAARSNKPLDFDLLARWNAMLLGQQHSRYRDTDAYAKDGRERYGTEVGEPTFVAYLSEANDASVPITIRAARVYLDVCFFHPFADGNARTARLALDWVLAREGFGLHLAEPAFMLARAANDADGALAFAWLLTRLLVRLA